MIELLRRFKLFVTAAEIVKTTQIEGLREAGGNQTFAKLGCGHCCKPTNQSGSWFCDRCLHLQDGCVICRETVKGRWTMCQVSYTAVCFRPPSHCSSGDTSLYFRKEKGTDVDVCKCRRVHTADTTVVSRNGSLTKIWTRVRRSGATMNVCLETTLIHNSKRFPCFSITYRLILVPLLLLSSGFVLWGLVLFFCWLDGWDGGAGRGS